ncbi:uncharacterized protein NFIA_093510 [Aspergillus fischeri NRRL 181]|uniref:Uncharacterized protein n=1 Tax=Neosartorya fischeri (strain ATCC 1020 / DSM 3700 / CBS 544.65 / FGSC A1164 / JCM 1740 / NRRL 181 / WB 181) TaxID=331117 RepID=A1DJ26_NEOFI|nr:uncharacterized protein NFIA_093510 [Aspergillus fischeri NRRL 181]EAW19383.1 hypothetical protein NFIA_093510 [Aspergillus fischeri NRRL 181]
MEELVELKKGAVAHEAPAFLERNLEEIGGVMPLMFIDCVTYGAGPSQVRLTTGVEPSRDSIRIVTKTGKYSLAWIELNRVSDHESA